MRTIHIYLALILAAVLTAGCAKEIEDTSIDHNSAAIELLSVSTDPMTKAVITGTSFTTDEAAAASTGLHLRTATTALMTCISTSALSIRTSATHGVGPGLSASSQNQNNKSNYPLFSLIKNIV